MELGNVGIEDLENYTDSLREYIDEESTDLEVQKAILDYVTELFELQLKLKAINDEIALVKSNATKNGVPVPRVNAVIDNIKKKLKQAPEAYEEEASIFKLFVAKNIPETIKATI